ncbi:DedA family protein [Candidatus Gracilibacteria bacterium]|nr:DedA family protein [Candidatus Gracilibacteria bacterium]
MHQIIDMIKEFLGQIGYTEIFIMMVLESSFFPFPSEVAMIPAGYLSSTGKLSFGLALLVGTFGALVGATINYLLGYYLGGKIIKSLIHKYGKYFFITDAHYEKTEVYFQKHGVVTTFLARFITVVRQLISLPAGVFKMNFAKFFFYTGLGAGLWNLALMTIGYIAGENSELIAKHSKSLLIGGVLLILLLGTLYFYYQKYKDNKKKSGK